MDTNSETFRFQCEVRTLLRWGATKPRGTVGAFLDKVELKRGKKAKVALETAYREQWIKGNRGEEGAWF